MAKRTKPRGTRLMKFFQLSMIGSFIILMGLFAMYYVTKPSQEIVETQDESVPTTSQGKLSDDAISQQTSTPQVIQEEVVLEEESEGIKSLKVEDTVEADLEMEPPAATDTDTEQTLTKVITVPLQDNGSRETYIEVPESKMQVQENNNERSPQDSSHDKVDIPLHGKYQLSISDDMVDEVGEIIAIEGVNPVAVLNYYLDDMSFSEKVKLFNFTLEKAKTVNVLQVWSMVEDGISNEDILELAQIIEDNFTVDEIDMLYEHYQKMDLAQNNNQE